MTTHQNVIDKLLKGPEEYLGIDGLKSYKLFFTKTLYNSTVSLLELIFEKKRIRLYIKTLLVKEGTEQYKDRQVISEYEILNKVYTLFKEYGYYMTPNPIALFRKEKTIVTEECPGESYYNFIINNSSFYKVILFKGEIEKSIWNCGKWLRIFHDNMPIHDNSDIVKEKIVTYSTERITLLSSGDNPCFDSGFAKRLSSMIYEGVGNINVKESELAFQHNDFALVNILHDEKRLAILDFTSSETGLIYNDLARFLGILECIKNASWQRRYFFERLQEIFLSGYGIRPEKLSLPFVLCQIKYTLANILSIHRVIHQKNSPLSLAERYWYTKFYKNQLEWLREIVGKDAIS